MNDIQWQDTFEIGIPIIDKQHKKLFELVNLFFEAINTRHCRSLAEPVLRGLVRYTQSHFKAEEAEMEKIGFPDLQDHRRQHQHLTDKATTAMNAWQDGCAFDRTELAQFLRSWLIDHIQQEDQKIGTYLKDTSGKSQHKQTTLF